MATGSSVITFYTHPDCTDSHRIHIALKELNLAYEEKVVNPNELKEPWYLDLNPRGVIPTLAYSGNVLTESGIIARFLCDAHPSHVLPCSTSPLGPLTRARIDFFVETWDSKVGTYWFQIITADKVKEKAELARAFVAAVEKDIEPLLKDVNPFFGGSEHITFSEVLISPFLLRIYALIRNGYLPTLLKDGIDALPCFSTWTKAAMAHRSVASGWDENRFLELAAERFERIERQNGAKVVKC